MGEPRILGSYHCVSMGMAQRTLTASWLNEVPHCTYKPQHDGCKLSFHLAHVKTAIHDFEWSGDLDADS